MKKLDAQNITSRAQETDQAFIERNASERPQTIQRIFLDLSKERPKEIPYIVNYPFKSFFVETTSDSTCFAYIKPNTIEEHQSHFRVSQRDAWSVERPVSKAYLFWPAQAGKKMELIFFADAEFKSGSQVSNVAGGISITDGTGVTLGPILTLVANTATIIAAASSTRKCATIQNKTPASIYIGSSTVTDPAGANEGIEIPAGGIFRWQNAAALYAWSVPGGKVQVMEEG